MGNAPGIGLINEGSLHAAIKARLAQPGDRLEMPVDGFIVDIVREGLLIEVQTTNFAAIRHKLYQLTQKHPLLLVTPIAQTKQIVQLAPEGNAVLSRRRSPKRGYITDLFNQLVRIPDLLARPNFGLQVWLIEMEEVRRNDGKGSWRRGGVSIIDRRLVEVRQRFTFQGADDLLTLLPDTLPQPFTNRDLAQAGTMSLLTARRMTYCLRQLNLLSEVDKVSHMPRFSIKAPVPTTNKENHII